jgi:hypothetical protein
VPAVADATGDDGAVSREADDDGVVVEEPEEVAWDDDAAGCGDDEGEDGDAA